MKKYVFTNKLTNAIEPAAPARAWGKGAPGKGGKTNNGAIVEKKTEKESV